MDLSWDEDKRARVLADRAIDFLDLAARLFDGRPLMTISVMRNDEERFVSIGPIDGKFYGIVWTHRDGGIRVITARRARNAEESQYRSLFP